MLRCVKSDWVNLDHLKVTMESEILIVQNELLDMLNAGRNYSIDLKQLVKCDTGGAVLGVLIDTSAFYQFIAIQSS